MRWLDEVIAIIIEVIVWIEWIELIALIVLFFVFKLIFCWCSNCCIYYGFVVLIVDLLDMRWWLIELRLGGMAYLEVSKIYFCNKR